MNRSLPTRICTCTASLLLLGSSLLGTAQERHTPSAPTAQGSLSAAPIERRPPNSGLGKPNGEHLAEWMNRHSDLTPEQQQKALAEEPGFKDLPAATQQRMRQHLARLDAMPVEKREHLLASNEAMEHLTPDQRGQVRGAMQQLAALPPDDRRYVARTFRGLRQLPPAQRQNVLNSERFNHLTEAQRATLNRLMQVEPLLPPPYETGSRAPQQ